MLLLYFIFTEAYIRSSSEYNVQDKKVFNSSFRGLEYTQYFSIGKNRKKLFVLN